MSTPSRSFRFRIDPNLAGRLIFLLAVALSTMASAFPGSHRTSATGGRALAGTTQATPVTVYGPIELVHTSSNSNSWAILTDEITADSVAGWQYFITLTTLNGSVTTAIATVNGQQFIGSSQYTSSTASLTQPIDVVLNTNTFVVQYKGSTNSRVRITVTRVQDPTFAVLPRTAFNRPPRQSSFTTAFTLPVGSAPPYALHLLNGTSSGANRLTGARLYVNGVQVIGSTDLGGGVAYVQRNVNLRAVGQPDTLLIENQAMSTVSTVWITATDSLRPQVTLSAPASDTAYTTASSYVVAGTVADSVAGLVSVNGGTPLATPGSFSTTLALPADGFYPVTVYAVGACGLDTTVTRLVVRDTQPPTLTLTTPTAAATFPADSDVVTFTGTWSDDSPTTVEVDGERVGGGLAGSFTLRVPLDLGPNGIYLVARDAAGNRTSFKRYVYRTPAEGNVRDSTTLHASTIDPTEVNSFRSQVAFIYNGSDTLQVLPDSSRLVAGQEAVLSGKVVARDFGALPNVRVEVLNHPELGHSTTSNDGQFNMVVNGGSPCVLRFMKPGFLELQRQVTPRVLDYTVLDSVSMIGRSGRSYAVADNEQMVVGRFEADANGERRLR